MFKYEIGGKTYIQKPLVLGQIEQMIDILEGINLPKSKSPKAIKDSLGDRLHLAIAIALVEEGKPVKRDLEEIKTIAEDLHWTINGETSLKVIEDFFACNPIASFWERLKGMMTKLGMEIKVIKVKSGRSSSSSPEETSQSETPSSGDSARPNAPDS